MRGVLKASRLGLLVILVILTARHEAMATDAGKGVGEAATSPLGAESAENDDAGGKEDGRTSVITPGNDVQWKDEAQKSRCQSYLTQLYESLYKARHHYFRGEPCECAEQTALFLEVAETCRADCPSGILEDAGYSRRIMRNVAWLKELNTKRCNLVKSLQPDPSQSPDKNLRLKEPVGSDSGWHP